MSTDHEKLFGVMPVGVIHVVDGTRVGFINAEGARLCGRPADAIVGLDFRELLTPESAQLVYERNRARREGRGVVDVYEATVLRPDGSTVQVELQARALGPTESLSLVRDVSGRTRDVELLQGLSTLGAAVQRAQSLEEAMRLAGEGLNRLGFAFGLCRRIGEQLVIAHVGGGGAPASSKLMGHSLVELPLPLDEIAGCRPVLDEGKSLFVDDLPSAVVTLFERRLGVPGAAVREAFLGGNAGKAVLHPIRVRGTIWGLCAICANTLTSADASALALFAAQLSSALEAAQTIETLGRRNLELAAINAVARAGAGAQLDVLLSNLARIAAEASGSDAAGIFLPDATKERLVLHGSHGYSEEAKRTFGQLSATSSATGEVLRTLRPKAITLLDWPESCRAQMAASGCHEMAILALTAQGRVLGTLNLRRRDARPYTPDELYAASVLANQIAVQVENARLYRDANRRVEMLSFLNELSRRSAEVDVSSLVTAVIEQMPRLVGVDAVSVHLVGADGRLHITGNPSWDAMIPADEAKRVAVIEVGDDSLVGSTARSRTTEIVNLSTWPSPSCELAKRFGFHHAITVPMLYQDRLVGVLTASRKPNRPFDRDEVALIETTAGQLAGALEQARLFTEERRRAQDLTAINEVGGLVAQHLELPLLVGTAVRRIAEIADVEHAFLMLRDESAPLLRMMETNVDPTANEIVLPIDGVSLAAEAVRLRQPVVVRDARNDPRVSQALVDRFGHRSMVGLPLIARGEVIGVVVLGQTRSERAFGPAEVERVLAMSNHLAAAVANARMYEEERRRVAELQRLQEELVKRERLAALGELAALVAHEVRNPLAVIFNSLASLKKARGTADAELLLRIVDEEAERLNSIVNDLLDFARPMEPKLRLEPLARILSGAAEVAASAVNTSHTRVSVVVDPALSISADARLLRQAFINLMVNALQAMPRGGEVKVEACTALDAGRELVQVAVTDDGPGIPKELHPRLFQPFFTTKATGTGLGLAVVKRTVEAHRGEVLVRSEPGEGTTFTIRLPRGLPALEA